MESDDSSEGSRDHAAAHDGEIPIGYEPHPTTAAAMVRPAGSLYACYLSMPNNMVHKHNLTNHMRYFSEYCGTGFHSGSLTAVKIATKNCLYRWNSL